MTLWELAACVDAYIEQNSDQPALEPPTDEEFEIMLMNSPALSQAIN